MPCPRIPVTGLVSTLFLSQVQTLIAQVRFAFNFYMLLQVHFFRNLALQLVKHAWLEFMVNYIRAEPLKEENRLVLSVEVLKFHDRKMDLKHRQPHFH